MKLLVNHCGTTHEIHVSDDCRIEQLHEQIETSTGVLKRRQKLIYKGKMMMPHHTLAQAKVRLEPRQQLPCVNDLIFASQ